MAGPDIFLSYNREDADVARQFAEAFKAQGFDVWWDDTLRSGETYDEVTEAALRGAKAVVVLWSPRSVASHWVRSEATIAHRAKTLVPARIEACDLPIMFELTQTADLSHWRGDASDRAFVTFLADVRRLVMAKAELPPPTRPALAAATLHDARPTIAVLPFISRSGLGEDEAFADEMVEDVTAALSFNLWMKVVAASATTAYRRGARDLRQIGRHLGVTYLLEGNVRRVGESLRVTAQLVEAETGNILWTRKFDQSLADVQVLQDELVTEVASHLGVQVQRAEFEHALKKPGNITAWEAFVKSVAFMCRDTRSGYEAAVAAAERAVQIDPDFGLAYSQLAFMQSRLSLYQSPDPDLQEEIAANFRKAILLGSDNPTVLVALASSLGVLGKPRDALPLAEHAVTINPNLDYTRSGLGRVLVQLGRLQEGIAEMEASERLAPNGAWIWDSSIWRSVAHLQAGRFEEAQEAANQAVRLLVGSQSLIQSALCLAILNDRERARDTLRRLQDTDAGIAWAHVENIVRYLHGHSNKVDEYVATVSKLWGEISGESALL